MLEKIFCMNFFASPTLIQGGLSWQSKRPSGCAPVWLRCW